MPSNQKAKTAHGTANDNRANRKAWKDGKSPEKRAQEASTAAQAKRERKATQA